MVNTTTNSNLTSSFFECNNCQILNASAARGGAILYAEDGNNIILNEMSISDYKVSTIGPIVIYGSSIEINKCNFSRNSAGML